MNHHLARTPSRLCIPLFIGAVASIAALAAPRDNTERLTTLRELKIEAGKIVRADHITAATSKTAADKSPPSRTVVKITLNPAKGSNIHVEIWLPESGKWNGRFIGLGNGGAAGSINPGIFAGPLAKGYAVATTDMGTAPNADSEINFGPDIDTYTAALAPYLNAENADLIPFEKRGGKLIMMSGSADSCVPYTATLD